MKAHLFFDIDGTLVGNGSKIADDTLSALRKAKENGHGLYISSGRNLRGLAAFRDIGMDGYVYSDGAGILINGFLEETHPLSDQQLQGLLALVDSLAGEAMIATRDWLFASKGHMDAFLEIGGEDTLRDWGVGRIEDYDGSKALEVDVAFKDKDAMNEFAYKLDPSLGFIDTSASYGRGGISLEVTLKGIDKGTGIKRAIRLMGEDMKNTYGFGDSMNDASMLAACAHGIAMGNAAQELKELAEYVTTDVDEGGIRKALEHFGII